MAGYTVYIGGEISEAVLDDLVEELNGDEYATITLPNNTANRTIVGTDKTVTIYYGTTNIFDGMLTGAEYTADTIKGYVYNKVYEEMDRLTYSASHDPTNANVILTAICALIAGVNAGACPATGINVWYRRTSCFIAAKYIAYVLNLDFYSTGGNTFNIGTKARTAQGPVTVTKVGRRSADRAQVKNRVYVRGWDSSGNAIEGVANSAGSQAAIGVREIAYFDRIARSVATLNNIAAQKLTELAAYTTSCKIEIPVAEGALFHSGDTVVIDDAEFALTGGAAAPYTIFRITKKPDVIQLELETIEKTTQDYLGDEFSDLESLGIYVTTPASTTGASVGSIGTGVSTVPTGDHGHNTTSVWGRLVTGYEIYWAHETSDPTSLLHAFYAATLMSESLPYIYTIAGGGGHFHGVNDPTHANPFTDPAHAHI